MYLFNKDKIEITQIKVQKLMYLFEGYYSINSWINISKNEKIEISSDDKARI